MARCFKALRIFHPRRLPAIGLRLGNPRSGVLGLANDNCLPHMARREASSQEGCWVCPGMSMQCNDALGLVALSLTQALTDDVVDMTYTHPHFEEHPEDMPLRRPPEWEPPDCDEVFVWRLSHLSRLCSWFAAAASTN